MEKETVWIRPNQEDKWKEGGGGMGEGRRYTKQITCHLDLKREAKKPRFLGCTTGWCMDTVVARERPLPLRRRAERCEDVEADCGGGCCCRIGAGLQRTNEVDLFAHYYSTNEISKIVWFTTIRIQMIFRIRTWILFLHCSQTIHKIHVCSMNVKNLSLCKFKNKRRKKFFESW